MYEERQEISCKVSRHRITPRERLIIAYVSSQHNRSFSHVSNVFFGYKRSLSIAGAIETALFLDDEALADGCIPLVYRESTSERKNKKEKMVVCYCPRCQKTYTRDVFWTGRGMPRMFCTDCRYWLGFGEPEEAMQRNKNMFRNYNA